MCIKNTTKLTSSSIGDLIRQAARPMEPLEALLFRRVVIRSIDSARPVIAARDCDGRVSEVDRLLESLSAAVVVYWGLNSWNLTRAASESWLGRPFEAFLDPAKQLWIPAVDLILSPEDRQQLGIQDGFCTAAMLVEEQIVEGQSGIAVASIYLPSAESMDIVAMAGMSPSEREERFAPQLRWSFVPAGIVCEDINVAFVAALIQRTRELNQVGTLVLPNAGETMLAITEPDELLAYAATLAIGRKNIPRA